MPQVLRPNDYSNSSVKNKNQTEYKDIDWSKQTILALLVGLTISVWLITTYLNNRLFFKEAALCSSIIFFLLFIRSKNIKRD